jgi:hypothetical protein
VSTSIHSDLRANVKVKSGLFSSVGLGLAAMSESKLRTQTYITLAQGCFWLKSRALLAIVSKDNPALKMLVLMQLLADCVI